MQKDFLEGTILLEDDAIGYFGDHNLPRTISFNLVQERVYQHFRMMQSDFLGIAPTQDNAT